MSCPGSAAVRLLAKQFSVTGIVTGIAIQPCASSVPLGYSHSYLDVATAGCYLTYDLHLFCVTL